MTTPPQSIYSYLKTENKNNEAKIYTKEYFQGLEVEIFQANATSPTTQTGGSSNSKPPISGPYKYFNYFFNNIKTVEKPTTTAQQEEPQPPATTPTTTQEQTPPPQQPAAAQEIFIFIKNAYGAPAQLDPSTLDIYDIERLAKTLTIQIKIHEKMASRKFSQIRAQDILFVNNQFIFFPPPASDATDNQEAPTARALGTFLKELLPTTEKQNNETKLMYFIKRAIEENQVLWV